MKKIITLTFLLVSQLLISNTLSISQSLWKGDGIMIRCFVDTLEFKKVEIQRKTNTVWKTQSSLNIDKEIFTYVDYTVNNGIYYKYRLKSIDSNDSIHYSNEINNIVLKLEPKENKQVWLTWNKHLQNIGEFSEYLIFRSIDGEPLKLMNFWVGAYNANDTIFIDNTLTSDNPQVICYQIRATQINSPIDFPDWMSALTSRSQLACTTFYSKILIPSAFNPNSSVEKNKTFGVNDNSVSNEGFLLTIKDRWGKTLFTTDNPSNRWDGYINGYLAPIGVYTYTINYKTNSGLSDIKIGTFILIK
jgi:gliding motility-associated-like protein